MKHTIYGYDCYPSDEPIYSDKPCDIELEKRDCFRGILFAVPFSIILWLLIVYLVYWLV